MESYRTIQGESQGVYEEKKSRFIADVRHVETEDQALSFLAEIRAAHPMARHHVYAYILNAGNRVRYSDDGEPQKTAGLPVLDVLQHEELKDVACVVTRYFGGTLLGTGGLVRAYTKAPQNALVKARFATFAPCRDILVALDYSLYEKLSYWVKTQGIVCVGTDFGADVTMTLRVLSENADETARAVEEFTQGKADVLVGEEQQQIIEELADL